MKRWPAGSAELAGVPLAIDDPNVLTRFIMLNPFTPGGPTATLAVTTSSGRVAITRGQQSNQVQVTVVAGGEIAFIKFGDSTVTAAATDTPVLPGTYRIFSVAPDVTHIAAITASTTATLYATPGNGQ